MIFRSGRTRMMGQSSVEWLIILMTVCAVVFLPFGGNPPMIEVFTNAIEVGFARFLGAAALPV